MRKTALIFELPSTLNPKEFIAQLSVVLPIQIGLQHTGIKNFYDSFDWRLYHAGMFCELNQSEHDSRFSLQNIAHPQELIAMELTSVPRFAFEFARVDFRNQLTLLLEMRALLKVISMPYQQTSLNILNDEQKTILRLQLDQFQQLPARVTVKIIKGYNKNVLPTIALLQSEFGLIPTQQPLILEALKNQGISVGTYSSKLKIQLDPDMHADIAVKYIYSHLLKAIQLNEQGCIDQIDSEFLHDFRVAVRRTRAGFSQIKQVLPTKVLKDFMDFFSWLGHITGSVRDIDVYLLNFQDFKQSLPITVREDIEPLRAYLLHKQTSAYQQLAKHLQSPRYVTKMAKWHTYLHEPVPKSTVEPLAKIPIKQLADQRIWKVYNRLLKEAKVIDQDTPPEMLHSLRKTAKKLRYLMEFFQALYPEMETSHLLKRLKELQTVLGDFQDCEVQEQALKQFSIELKDQGVPPATFLAMGVLIQTLEQRKNKARLAFSKCFEQFAQTKYRHVFKDIFSPSV